MAGINLSPLPSNLPDTRRTPLAFLADTTSPVLVSFDLDLSNRMLTLSFSEPVRVQSLNASGLTLLSNPFQSHEDYVHTFQSLNPVSTDGTRVVCVISSDDVSAILIRTGLAVSIVS